MRNSPTVQVPVGSKSTDATTIVGAVWTALDKSTFPENCSCDDVALAAVTAVVFYFLTPADQRPALVAKLKEVTAAMEGHSDQTEPESVKT